MTQLCHMGRVTDNPCTNVASTEADFGTPVCEEHKAIIDLGEVADDYFLVENLIDEAIEKANEVGAESAVPLLERARNEARREYRRVVQEMQAMEPERR
jgi:hypothetical protein